jgi:hypothetical protein
MRHLYIHPFPVGVLAAGSFLLAFRPTPLDRRCTGRALHVVPVAAV